MPTVQFTSQSIDVSEGAGSVAVRLSLSAASAQAITVQVTPRAYRIDDMDVSPILVIFQPEEIWATFSSAIYDDTVYEGDEVYGFEITGATNAQINGDGSATILGYILDNEGPIVVGTAGSDALIGTERNETIEGLAGNDVLRGLGGGDTLIGGAGADVFAGLARELNGDTIVDLSVGDRITVTDIAHAAFSYVHAGSSLSFGGATVDTGSSNVRLVTATAAGGGTDLIAAHRITRLNDFDGNGHSDILWRENGGTFATWGVSGQPAGNQLEGNTTFVEGVGTDWKIAETFDFDGDGRSDILWRNQPTGEFSIWNGAGTSWTANSYFDRVSGDWTVAGVGDLNNDGMDDIVWRQDGGAFATWQSTGSGFNVNVTFDTSVPPDWKIVGLADFNGDGKDDLLWRNQGSGALAIWSSTGAGFTPNTYFDTGVATNWHVDGLADFNGDGRDDILWRRDGDGLLAVWQSTGTDFNKNTYVDSTVPTVWQVANTGDFDNDGKADLMFRNIADGTFATWESNGDAFDPNINFVAGVGTNWQVQAHDFAFG
jgi:hypothetical protein